MQPPTAQPAQTQPLPTAATEPLMNGMFEEDANLNLEAAIDSYLSMISSFDSQRPAVANAIFRLGECYRKLGHTEEAKVQFARILREFPDQAPLVKLSQQRLFPSRTVARRSNPFARPGTPVSVSIVSPAGAAPAFAGAASSHQPEASYPALPPTDLTPVPSGTTVAPEAALPAGPLGGDYTLGNYSMGMNPTLKQVQQAREDQLRQQLEALPEAQRKSLEDALRAVISRTESLDLKRQVDALAAESEAAHSAKLLEDTLAAEANRTVASSRVGDAKAGRLDSPLAAEADQMQREWLQAKTASRTAESAMREAEQNLDNAQKLDPFSLPATVANDPSYQKLKQEYEAMLLDDSGTGNEKAKALDKTRAQLERWRDRILVPEKNAALVIAQRRFEYLTKEADRLQMRYEQLREQMEKLKADVAQREATTIKRRATALKEGTPIKARVTAPRDLCVANLRQLAGAKEQWAFENHKPVGTEVKMSDLVPTYLKSEPKCPVGGEAYVLNPVGTNPVCPNNDPNDPDLSRHKLGR